MTDIENQAGVGTPEVPDLEAQRKELLELQAELDKRARDLNKGFMEIAERERKLAEKPPFMEEESDDDDDLSEVPEAAAKVMDKYIAKKVDPVLKAQQELYNETVNEELAKAAEKNGISTDDILDVINTRGLVPRDMSLKAAREIIKSAADMVKASRFDESEVEKRIREKILAELAEEGTRIEGITPTRELPNNQNLDEESLSPAEKYELFKSRRG